MSRKMIVAVRRGLVVFALLMLCPAASWAQPVEELGGEAGGAPIEDIGSASPDGESIGPPSRETRTRSYQTTIAGAPAQVIAYYSPALRGFFAIRWFRRGSHVFPGAKLVAEADFDSPLNRLGLRSGDIITRLDDLRVRDYDELENHFADTSVRFIRHTSGIVRVGTVYIDAGGLNP